MQQQYYPIEILGNIVVVANKKEGKQRKSCPIHNANSLIFFNPLWGKEVLFFYFYTHQDKEKNKEILQKNS